MAEINVITTSTTSVTTTTTKKSPRLIISKEDGSLVVGLPIAPREVTYDNWGMNWAQVPRDGKIPYLLIESVKLPTISFTAVLANAHDPRWDATPTLVNLKIMSNSIQNLRLSYGGFFESNYKWRITNWSFSSVYRHPKTNAITHAEVNLEFTMVQDSVITVGPLTTTKAPTPKILKPKTVKNLGKRKYKIKSGDTLQKLSIKFYKSSKYWRYLADINKIRSPKYDSKMTPGKTIKY